MANTISHDLLELVSTTSDSTVQGSNWYTLIANCWWNIRGLTIKLRRKLALICICSKFRKLSPTQTPNGPQKYTFKRRAAAYYNGTRTLVVLVISQVGFAVMLHLVHLRFFAKTWLPRFQFLRVCSLFLSILCLLYAKILEICSNRLYTSSSLVLYIK